MFKTCNIYFQTFQSLKVNNRTYCVHAYKNDSISHRLPQPYVNKRQYLYETCCRVVNNDVNVNELRNDSKFVSVCDAIVNDLKRFKQYSLSALIDMTRSMLFMNLDPELKVVQYLENELLFLSVKLSAREIVECLSFHYFHRKTDLQKKLYKNLVYQCHEKFEDIATDSKILLNCWKFYDQETLGDELTTKIEDATIEILINSDDGIDPKILMNIVIALSNSQRRNFTLLKIISERLSNENLKEFKDANLVIGVIAALNNLNLPDITLLNSLKECLNNSKIEELKPNAISTMLTSMGKLNWKYTDFLEKFVDYVDTSKANFTTKQFVTFILTIAKLNYNPSGLENFLQNHIFPNVTLDTVGDKKLWLGFVWSLAILGHLNSNHIKSVFNSSFYKSVLEVDSIEQTFIKMKLLNIKAVANLEMNVIFETAKDIENFVQPMRTQNLSKLNNKVIQDLRSVLPRDKLTLTDVKSPIGAIISAQFVVNPELWQVPVETGGTNQIDVSLLPKGYKRVNLFTFQFKDRLLESNELIGVHNLIVRLLKQLGEAVIIVDDTVYDRKATDVQRIMLLRNLIKQNFK